MEETPMALPACWRSTSAALYLLVVANGRMENDDTRLSVVAISSARARRRKSRSLSAPASCRGSTAMDLEPADSVVPVGLRLVCKKNAATARRAIRAVAANQSIGFFLDEAGLSTTADTGRDSVSRLSRCKSVRISEAG